MPGRIITFYSYKGGAGRSMALANTAWVLAGNALRVLVVDWDLEAPGLHRYFHPFLDDKELTGSKGIIDLVVDFAAAAFAHSEEGASGEGEWYLEHANILRYASSLDWEFPAPGSLDFVPAGRQDSSYPIRVNSFHWQNFYERLGGGLFLEAVKSRMRAEYDYVLIDSRTGVSDTSGICTVQMPDDLVVCFTLNNQNLEGAAAVAQSVQEARALRDGSPGIKIWPVPMRVELFEKEKLEVARDAARQRFQQFLPQEARDNPDQYWGAVEVPYQPFYAFEEVLAAFADRPGQPTSMLSSIERLTTYLTKGAVTNNAPVGEPVRQDVLRRYTRQPGQVMKRTERPLFYLSCAPQDASRAVREFFEDLLNEVRTSQGSDVTGALTGGEPAADHNAVVQAEVMVCLLSSAFVQSTMCLDRFLYFQGQRKPVLPVLWDEFQPGGSPAAQDLMFRLRAFGSSEKVRFRLLSWERDSPDYRREVRALARRVVRSAKHSRGVGARPVRRVVFSVLSETESTKPEELQPFDSEDVTLGEMIGDTASDLYLAPEIVNGRSLTEAVRNVGEPTSTVLVLDARCLNILSWREILTSLRNRGLLDVIVCCLREVKRGTSLSDFDATAADLESHLGVRSFYAYNSGMLEQSLHEAVEYALHRSWRP